jgi:RNA polymerase sigma-70 factor, ECF subfamily
MIETDEELAFRAQQGEATAFRALLQRHYDRIYRVAYRYLGSAADAEDVAQDVCTQLARKLSGFGGRSRFTTWIYAVALNAARDFGRRRRTISALQGAYVDYAEQRDADWADSDGRVRWLYVALDRLDPGLKDTALLILAEELTHADAAVVLGIKESTVSWRMHEVKKRLKAMVQHE